MHKNQFELFVRKYTLLASIGMGVILYVIYRHLSFLNPYKVQIKALVLDIVPFLIFGMLYVAFCKIDIKSMRLRMWHLILIIAQIGIPFIIGFMLSKDYASDREVYEGLMVLIICPTAAASAIITGKLGGSEASLTSYTLVSNVAAAITIPFIFAYAGTKVTASFADQMILIANKVFPMILLPLLLAFVSRYILKGIHSFLITTGKDLPFYMWALTLTIVTAQVASTLVNASVDPATMAYLAFIGFVACIGQYVFGKFVGNFYAQRVSAGQGLGQKNVVFAIWLAATYFSQSAVIAAACYMIFQNGFNALQLFYKDTYDKKRAAKGLKPYQEI